MKRRIKTGETMHPLKDREKRIHYFKETLVFGMIFSLRTYYDFECSEKLQSVFIREEEGAVKFAIL